MTEQEAGTSVGDVVEAHKLSGSTPGMYLGHARQLEGAAVRGHPATGRVVSLERPLAGADALWYAKLRIPLCGGTAQTHLLWPVRDLKRIARANHDPADERRRAAAWEEGALAGLDGLGVQHNPTTGGGSAWPASCSFRGSGSSRGRSRSCGASRHLRGRPRPG